MTDAPVRSTLWLHLAWITAAAVLTALGDLHRHHHADALIPVLSSLYRWTPYYWEQNRFGMLVALVTTPFDHPVTNLLVQNGITAWAGFACFPLAARYLFAGRLVPAAGPLAAAAFTVTLGSHFRWEFLSTCNVFAVSLALGLVGLLAVAPGRAPAWPTPWRWAAAVACFAAGSWVNAALGVLLLPVVVLTATARWTAGGTPDAGGGRVARLLRHSVVRDAAPGAALSAFGVVLAMALQRLSPYQTTWVNVPPVRSWAGLVRGMAEGFWAEAEPQAWAATLAGCVAVGAGLALVRPGSEARRGFLVWVGAATAAAGYAALMAVLFGGRPRYAVPAVVLAHVPTVGWAVRAVAAGASDRAWRWTFRAAAVAAVAAVPAADGWPSKSGVERTLRDRFGRGADDLIAARCTHVAGDYWRVWPAVFATNWEYHDRGEGRRVWGLSFRSRPTADLWRGVPRAAVRVGVFNGDEEGPRYIRELLGVPVVFAERRGAVDVYVPE